MQIASNVLRSWHLMSCKEDAAIISITQLLRLRHTAKGYKFTPRRNIIAKSNEIFY